MLTLMEDTVSIEPFSSLSSSQAATYGTAVNYSAQVLPYSERGIDAQGKEWKSTCQVIIPERVAVDIRSRITLPAGFVPNQPPIRAVRPIKGLSLDHTQIVCG
jgi:hypothetical protein